MPVDLYEQRRPATKLAAIPAICIADGVNWTPAARYPLLAARLARIAWARPNGEIAQHGGLSIELSRAVNTLSMSFELALSEM